MHTMWKGSISFGLVNIPVRMFAATEEKDIRFRYLHNACKTPIEYVSRCPRCQRDVERDEIVRGYEYEPGKFVILTEEDLSPLQAEGGRSIDILDFISLAEIDPVYFHKSYYLSPGETGSKAYALLKRAMEESGKIAVARITLRNKSHLAAVRVFGQGLVMETLFYPDEVRDPAQVPGLPAEGNLHEKEVHMAVQLVQNLAAPFQPEKYTDEYRENLRAIIAQKIAGGIVDTAPAARPANVVDLMEALQASLKATGKENQPAQKAARKPKKATATG